MNMHVNTGHKTPRSTGAMRHGINRRLAAPRQGPCGLARWPAGMAATAVSAWPRRGFPGALLLLGCALVLTATPAVAGVVVNAGSGFTFTGNAPAGSTVPASPVDIALATNGSTPFAISQYGTGSPHWIGGLNNGLYGNSNSWISAGTTDYRSVNLGGTYGSVNMSFAGVALPSYSTTLYTLTGFTFGRSNLGEYGDRIAGTMYVQYAPASSANLTNPSASYDTLWTTIGSLTTTDVYDHVFTFNSPVNTAGLRIVTTAGNCIDEIAMYGTPYVLAEPTWTGTTDAQWSTGTNWSTPPAPGTGSGAVFDNAGNGNTTVNLGAGVTINTIRFDKATVAAYTIGSGAVGSQTLTLNAGGAIVVNSTVTNSQSFNANLTLGTANGDDAFTVTNNSITGGQLLTLAGSVSSTTTGAKTLTVNGAGNTRISGIISNGSGTLALTKADAGALTLTGNNTYSGATTISGGTLRVGRAALPARWAPAR